MKTITTINVIIIIEQLLNNTIIIIIIIKVPETCLPRTPRLEAAVVYS